MKMLLKIVLVGIIGNLGFGVWNTHAYLEVSAAVAIHAKADFYVPLESHGAWIEVGGYGRCWRPAGVVVGWRPYCDGHWEWTDCGWYWVSDEPWGWACYHYGRWVYDPAYAWVWVPGIEWAPAWVEWRVGGGYIGWAPLGAPQFVFVASSRFHEPVRPSTVIVNNTTIINKTTVINNIKHETRTVGGSRRQTVVVNDGPGVAPVQKATGRTIKAVPIQVAALHSPPPASLQHESSGSKGRDKRSVSPSEQPKATPATPPASDRKSVSRDTGKPKPGKESVAPSPNRPASAPAHNQPPHENRERPDQSPPDNHQRRPSDNSVSPSPNQPPGGPPPGRSLPGKGSGPSKGQGKGHEGDHPGHDKEGP